MKGIAHLIPLVLFLASHAGCTLQSGSLRFSDPRRTPAATEPEQLDAYSIKHELASRTYVNSVLRNVFSIVDDDPEAIQLGNVDSNYNVLFNTEYGGGCDPYAASEKVHTSTATSTTFVREFPEYSCAETGSIHLDSPSSPGRFAVTNTVCDFLIKRNTMSYRALRKVQTNWADNVTNDPSEQDALAIYRLFLPDETPRPEVLSELMKVAASGSTPPLRWKNLLYFMCILPDWQDLR